MATVNFDTLVDGTTFDFNELDGLIIEGSSPGDVEYFVDSDRPLYVQDQDSSEAIFFLTITDTVSGKTIIFDNFPQEFSRYRDQITFVQDEVSTQVTLDDGLRESLAAPTEQSNLIWGTPDANIMPNAPGDQTILGQFGSDTYTYSLGDGNDTIVGYKLETHITTLQLIGIDPSDVSYSYEPSKLGYENNFDFVVTINSTQETITIVGAIGSRPQDSLNVNQIVFDDGTVYYPSNGLDNTIDFVAGNESVGGTSGGDTYIYTAGDDQDTIFLNEAAPGGIDVLQILGYGSGDLILTRVDEQITIYDSTATIGNLVINFKGDTGGSDQITIQGFFNDDLAQQIAIDNADDAPPEIADFYQYVKSIITPIEQIQFEDGTVLSSADISELLNAPDLNIINGTEGNDNFSGSPGDDEINGLGGNDTLRGLAGNDTINGDAGNDRLFGNAGDDTLNGGAGKDVLNGGAGSDTLVGGAGNDTYVLRDSQDKVVEVIGGGTDTVNIGGSLTDYVLADNVERLIITNGAGTVVTAQANDLSNTVFSGVSNDTLDGGQGVDTINYSRAQSAVTVDLSETGAQDTGHGIDTLINFERVVGSKFDDALSGDNNRNTLNGGAGDDTLNGGYERDVLIGGAGNDTFVFDAELVNSLSDIIRDFSLGDMIALNQDIFSSLNLGALSSDNFVSGAGAVALDADDHLIYNTTNGRLSYDADGSGSGSAIVVAILQNDYDLSATDISVI